jgi:hypothetical protein
VLRISGGRIERPLRHPRPARERQTETTSGHQTLGDGDALTMIAGQQRHVRERTAELIAGLRSVGYELAAACAAHDLDGLHSDE